MKTLRYIAAARIPIGTILNERENVIIGNVLYEMKQDISVARNDLELADIILETTVSQLSNVVKGNICGGCDAMRMAMDELIDLYESIQYWRYEILQRGDVDYGFAEMEMIVQSCIVRPPAYINRTELANVLRGILAAWDEDNINVIDHTVLMESHALLYGFILDYITLVKHTYDVFRDANYIRYDTITMLSRKIHMDRIIRNIKREIFNHECEDIERVSGMVREDPPEGCIATLRHKCTACGEYYDGEICCPDMVHMPVTDYEPT